MRPAAILAVHAVVFAVLLWWSWRKWPDPLIDFGRELYVPWQITRGRVLYRDIASLFGPLSPYVNALWFRLFGASLMTLVVANLVIFAATVAGMYRFVRASTDRVTATVAGISTLLLFGFSQYVDVSNYNFVCPYSHEATHGIALSIGLLLALQSAVATGRRVFWGVAGACFGLVILTKPEIAVAAAAAVAAAWIGTALLDPYERDSLRRGAPLFVLVAAMPPAVFFLFFAAHMPPAEAMRAIAGAWTPTVGTAITKNQFYLRVMGLDRPAANALRMLLTFGGFVIFVAAAIAVSWTRGRASRASVIRRVQQIVLLLAVIGVAQAGTLSYALPLITLTALIATVVMLTRASRDRDQALRSLSLVTFSAFALALLAKIALNARIGHYGFYLTLPAMVVAIILTCRLIPELLAAWASPAGGRTFRQTAVLALAAVIAPYLVLSHGWYRTKVIPVGSGADLFFASNAPGMWQGAAVPEAQRQLERAAAPGSTLAVLPEGVMLNYLLRRDSPLRVINLMPPEILAFGEDDVLRSLEAAPPDTVALVYRDVREYGYPLFGTDARYGLRILQWIKAHYRRVSAVGHDPMSDSGFAIEIFERTS